MSEISKDSTVIDNFVEKLRHYSDVQSQLGESDRALIVSKAARVIEILCRQCMLYNVGIPAQQLYNIIVEKK